MAAQRLGAILSNVTGTSKQILRVNESETGFEFVTPTTIPSYTVTNDTPDRVINADDVTLDEVADVLSTLIKDLQGLGAAAPAAGKVFTYETTHTDSTGGTQYTITHNFGQVPDLIECYVKENGYWKQASDLFYQSGYYGWLSSRNATSVNESKVQLYNVSEEGGTHDVRIKCYLFGSLSITPFQWTTSEQIYPYEKADDGSTLYAKRYDLGALPNTGTKDVALGIGNPAGPYIHRLYLKASAPDGTYTTLNYASPGYANYAIAFQIVTQYIRLVTAADYSGWTNTQLYLIYKK